MKRLICLLLGFTIIFTSFSAFALNDNDNEELKNILSIVKGKIDVDEDFTEFNMSVRGNNTESGMRRYDYFWENKDRTKSLSVSADKFGNVLSYSIYDSKNDKIKIDISIKYETAFKEADAFIKQTLPLCFEDKNDSYVIKDTTAKTGTLSGNTVVFNFTYERIKDGYPVWGNDATVSVLIAGDKPLISNLNSNWDYESVFHKADKIAENPEESYLEKFPVEMVYKNKFNVYKLSTEEDMNTPSLVYRFKDNNAGYILADSGEVFQPKKNNVMFNAAMKEEMSADSATGGALRGDLAPEEIARIEEISSLISADDAYKILSDNKHLSIDEKFVLNSSSLFKKNYQEDEYSRTVSLGYSTDAKSGDIYATLDAKNGDIISYSRSVYGPDVWNRDVSVKENEKTQAFDRMEAFVKDTAKSYIHQYRLKGDNTYNLRLEKTYERYIDGVRYIDNTISVSYDLGEDFISGYNISYTKEFKNLPLVKDAIEQNKAEEIIFTLYPLRLSYMKGEDGYYLCFGNESNRNAEIFAINGEKISYNSREVNLTEYKDADNHWVKDIADNLMNVGIGFENGILNPDEKCTQNDFLRIMMCAVNKSTYYLTYTDEDLYSRLNSRKYVLEEEKNPSGNVAREDAFVYTVRMMNHEEIAKLKSIFKTDFADNSDISSDKIGYAAILKGMGLISGDGIYLRPKEDITRAEVISMAYNYITK